MPQLVAKLHMDCISCIAITDTAYQLFQYSDHLKENAKQSPSSVQTIGQLVKDNSCIWVPKLSLHKIPLANLCLYHHKIQVVQVQLIFIFCFYFFKVVWCSLNLHTLYFFKYGVHMVVFKYG